MTKPLSFYSWIVCVILLAGVSFCYYPRWKGVYTEATISWDVSGYYMYLPAALIYQDLKKLAFFPDIQRKYNPDPYPASFSDMRLPETI